MAPGTSVAIDDEGPSWANMISEVLAEIFKRLPFQERLTMVPLVCKTWRSASYDPACWRTVDMGDWFQKKVQEDYWWEFECEPRVELLVKAVVDRSSGQLRELRAMHCSDAAIEYVAERCPSLTVLSIPGSLFVTDKSATKLAARCPDLQELDVSDCYNISNQALESIGRHCTSLVWLGRNMLQRRLDYEGRLPAEPGGDEEAKVVSKHMVRLKHLEMKRTSLSDLGLEYLARGCGELETLNLACCEALSPKALDEVSKRCTNIREFTKPITPRMHGSSSSANFWWVLFD